MINEKSCGVILFREENNKRAYLLLHYEEGHWDFPKGHVEEGESETDTASRETREETGIDDLTFTPNFREHISYGYSRKGNKMHKDVYFFLARTNSKKVRLSDEHIGSEWLSYDSAVKKLTFDNAKDVLRKAENFLKSS